MNSFYTEGSSGIYTPEKDSKFQVKNNFKNEIKKLFNGRSVNCVIINNINKMASGKDGNFLYAIIGIFSLDFNQNQRFSHTLIVNKENKIVEEVLVFLDESVIIYDKINEHRPRKNRLLLFINHPEKKSEKEVSEDFKDYGSINNIRVTSKGYTVEYGSFGGVEKALQNKEEWVDKGYQSSHFNDGSLKKSYSDSKNY